MDARFDGFEHIFDIFSVPPSQRERSGIESVGKSDHRFTLAEKIVLIARFRGLLDFSAWRFSSLRQTARVEPNATALVNPSQASVDALAAWPDDSPIGMLNLLSFDGEEGRAAYGRYAAVASKTVVARGGSAIFMGSIIEPADSWDTIVIVYYPRRAAYLDMQLDPAYVGALPDRTAGLSARLLYPFALIGEDAPHIDGSNDEVFELELVRWPNEPTAISVEGTATSKASGKVDLDLASGGPGMVSDGRWDRLRLTRYASIDSWKDRPETARLAGDEVADTMSLLISTGSAV